MMSCAIYSDGPSLLTSWKGGYDLGICINRAANKIPFYEWDWLCGGDMAYNHPHMGDIPIPNIGYCSMKPPGFVGLTLHERPVMFWDRLPGLPLDTQWSITASLYLAAALKVNSVSVYGHTQQEDELRYTERRKASENRELKTAAEYLESVGVLLRFC